MKSMLQEAPTVLKAIEKAWRSCGEPEEFTIKVLEHEKKSFWGTIKKPAVISIVYEAGRAHEKITPEPFKREKIEAPKQPEIKRREEEKRSVQAAPVMKKQEIAYGWTKEFINDVTFWLKEITSIMGFKINFNLKVDQKILNIYLDQSILQEKEDEKMFFISISHLLMQFLKRKYKKKFNNYYLIIHSRVLSSDGK